MPRLGTALTGLPSLRKQAPIPFIKILLSSTVLRKPQGILARESPLRAAIFKFASRISNSRHESQLPVVNLTFAWRILSSTDAPEGGPQAGQAGTALPWKVLRHSVGVTSNLFLKCCRSEDADWKPTSSAMFSMGWEVDSSSS